MARRPRPSRRPGRLRRLTPVLACLAAATAAVLTVGPAARAADGSGASGAARVSHVERTDTGFSVVLDVPDGTQPDLTGVTATVSGLSFPATAAPAAEQTTLARTAVLAIDTSDSMGKHGRFAAAKAAADAFLAAAPANVAVGVVTFNSSVTTALAPTLDRTQATAVIAGLGLSKGTRLYDGVEAAITAAGGTGQRSVIVISDGADTSSNVSLDQAARDVRADGRSGVAVDVVTLDGNGNSALRRLAGDGQVIPATSEALVATFGKEASVLQHQVAIDVAVPADKLALLAGDTVSVTVSVPSSTGVLDASAAVPPAAQSAAPVLPPPPAAVATAAGAAPSWLKYVAALLVGVGLLGVLSLLLVPTREKPLTVEARISTYTQQTAGGPEPAKASGDDALASAKQAAASVLSRNRDLEQRISQRLDGAGSALKPSEWLLVHVAVFVLVTLVGLVLGGGNLVLALLFMLLGGFGPWLYLGLRRSRRRKAFDSALPDTLQLMSGSLSAGLSLAQSVDTVSREGAEPVSSEFRRVLVETRLGVSLEDAFDHLAARFASRDFSWVVMAIRIQRQVGGNLAEVLDSVAETMREREYVRRQVAALAAEGKLSAIVLGGLPPLFLLFLLVTNRTYVMPLFTTGMGLVMLVGAGLVLAVGVFWMSKLAKVEV